MVGSSHAGTRCLNSKVRRETELFSEISPRQLEKIDRSFGANADKFVGSDACVAMQNDLRMFGDAAFAPDRSTGEDGPKVSKKSS